MAGTIAGCCCRSSTAWLGTCSAWWRCWPGLICPKTPSCWCYATRIRCYAASSAAGCGGSMPTGCGLRRCRGWRAAAGGRRSSRSPRPRSCAGTGTSSPPRRPQVGLQRSPKAGTAAYRHLSQGVGRPDGAGEPSLGPPQDPRRAGEARSSDRRVHSAGDPARRGHPSGAPPGRGGMAGVPCRPGARDHRL